MKKVLRKVLKVILIVLAVVAVIVIALGLASKQRSEKYYKYSNPVGEIEKQYTSMGSYKVAKLEITSGDQQIGRFVIYYPEAVEDSEEKYPVVLWANGTGSKSKTYTPFLKHLSSWGFIVVSNDDENTRTGASLNAGIDMLMAENEKSDSKLYQRIDLDRIGIGGHSQGGPAVFNMASVQPHADMIKTVYAVSATSSYHTRTFKDGWEYDISKVHVPTLLTAGTGSFDAGTAESSDQESDEKAGIMQGICPLWSLQENFNLLLDDIDKAYFRKKNVDHGDSYLQFDAYMTAWFRWQLQGDEDAAKAFTGDSPEIMTNDLYQDQEVNIEMK